MVVQYGIYSSEAIQFQKLPNGNLTGLNQTTFEVSPSLVAGEAYVFRVIASNVIGSASVNCLPVMVLIGELQASLNSSTYIY